MDKSRAGLPLPERQRNVRLDQHDSVRCHVQQQLIDEVAQLEKRIETLRLTKAPHAAIMISAYERMIDRKKGFMKSWDLPPTDGH